MAGKPAQMKQATWDYLLKFTDHHEGTVLHMYNNRTESGGRQDVTCGVGFLIASRDESVKFQDMFFDKDTQQPATADQMVADWDTAAGIARLSYPNSNLESTPDGTGYADQCQLRMYPGKVTARRNEIMGNKITQALKDVPLLSQFYEFPAQAQVAVGSFSYGFSPRQAPNMVMCLFQWDFDGAGQESALKNLSALKLRDHRSLFWNAARICEQKLDFDQVPLSAKQPGLIAWQPWSGTSGVMHDQAPNKPAGTN